MLRIYLDYSRNNVFNVVFNYFKFPNRFGQLLWKESFGFSNWLIKENTLGNMFLNR